MTAKRAGLAPDWRGVRSLRVAALMRLALSALAFCFAATAAAQPAWKPEKNVDLVIANWQGAIGPPKLTAAQIAYWDGVFARSAKTDEWRADQEQNLWESDYLNAADFSRFLKTDYEQAKAIFVELGLAK